MLLSTMLANSANALNRCERETRGPKSLRNRAICSPGGLCMEIADNSAGYLYVYCYDRVI